MKRKARDRHLDAPAEANRDKHINFIALERGEEDPADVRPAGKTSGKKKNATRKAGWKK